MTEIALLDYGLGNVRSVSAAITKCKGVVVLTKDKKRIFECKGLVLPGVGAFSHGMKSLEDLGLDKVIREFSETGKPILGICLGMQLLMSKSHEFAITDGLDIIPGVVKRLKRDPLKSEKLPHISWSRLESKEESHKNEIVNSITSLDYFYFVHSYAVHTKNPDDVIMFSDYAGQKFPSVIRKGAVIGCQFHPEKSGPSGLKFIKKFINLCGERVEKR